MSVTTKLVVSPLTPSTQLVDPQTGRASWDFLKFAQNLAQAVNTALTILGQFDGVIGTGATVEGHGGTLASTVNNLTPSGQLNSLTNVAADVNLDHINDTATYQRTTVQAVQGAQLAYSALVASGPTAAKALLYNGTDWTPSDVPYTSISGAPLAPLNTLPIASKWLDAYNASTGAFTQTQPDFSDLTGAATAAQVPALSALSGQITTSQLPAAGASGTINLAKLTGTGTNGSITVTNGLITAFVNPT